MGLDSFKWVLYGDDDTVFFVDGALDMLENLDYNMPYLLSDDVWFVEDDGKHGSACIQNACISLLARCMQSGPGCLVAADLCYPFRCVWTQLIVTFGLCQNTLLKLHILQSC